ncbi:MAG: hypothetical protein ACRDE5_03625 [Ginsengibacter sp.]
MKFRKMTINDSKRLCPWYMVGKVIDKDNYILMQCGGVYSSEND